MFTQTARRPAKIPSIFRSCYAKAVVEVVGKPEPPLAGLVRFVADEGLLLESDQYFEVDVPLVLHVTPREGSALLVSVRVSRCNRLPSGKWGLSCTFDEWQSPHKLRNVLC